MGMNASLQSMSPHTIRIALVDNDQGSIDEISKALDRDQDLRLACVHRTAKSFLEEHMENTLDVVIVNICLPGMNGIECVARAKSERPRTQFLIYTAFENPAYIFQALRAGATGYLLKHQSADKIGKAIRELHTGGSPLSANIARMVVNSFQNGLKVAIQDHFLTEREKGVMDQLANGFMYKEIAARSGISTETVRKHVRNIYGKLEVGTRMEAMRKVYPERAHYH